MLEVVLRVYGAFRQCLAPLRLMPLQAGVILYLYRHPDAKVTDTAAGLSIQPATLTAVIDDLVHKRWVSRYRIHHDRRVVRLRLTQRGELLAGRITGRIRGMKSNLTIIKEV
jgi:DNA-binding MarR family transcriptional regulator